MQAAKILEEEHKVILTVLNVLARVVERTRREGRIPEADARDTIHFFREYADKCHHSKEEDSLFPAMEAAGFPHDSGPTAVMRMEHEMGRKLVSAMHEALAPALAGNAAGTETFCDRATEFIGLLSQHIGKEDHCLFPMACQAMGESACCNLFDSFRRIEKDAGGQRHRAFLASAHSLCERYGVQAVAESALPEITKSFLPDQA